MNKDEFQLARAIFDELCDAPSNERQALLEERAAGNAEVRRLVESLLAEDEKQPEDFASPGALPDLSPSMPKRVGPYRLIRVCGRGGMGLVYEAEQENPRRRVAIKMIRAGLLTKEVLRRFRWETEILGRLQHPSIGQILEAGTVDADDGPQPYFAMEYIEGLTLIEHANARGLTAIARMELMTRVCEAVHYAHQRGVIHRDLKPDNIIVTKEGTASEHESSDHPMHGLPKILDFGIARATDPEGRPTTLMTHAGQLVGTLQYMSPEQATGNAAEIDTRSDIYSIGVLLFELLSGKLPYDLSGASISDALRTIETVPAARLGDSAPALRGDVETIVAKCLEKEPEMRYASASELAEDIRRHMRCEPIAARPPSALYHIRKFVQRRRALVGGVVATLVAAVCGIVLTLNFAFRADASADRALRESYRAGIAAASALILDDPTAARRYLEATPPELRGWEWDHLSSRLQRHLLTYDLPGSQDPNGPVFRVRAKGPMRFDTEGKHVLTIIEDGSSSSKGTEGSKATAAIGVWDASTGAFLRSLHFDADVTTFDLRSAAPLALAVGTADGRVFRCDLDGSGRAEVALGPMGAEPAPAIRGAHHHPGGGLVIATDRAILAVEQGDVRELASSPATAVAVAPDGSSVAALMTASFRGITLVDFATGDVRTTLLHAEIRENPYTLTYGENGERLFVGTEHRLTAAFDATTLERMDTLAGHRKIVRDLDWHQPTHRLATSSDDGTIRVWRGNEPVAVLDTTVATRACSIAFAPDGKSIAYSADDTIRLWNLDAGRSTVLEGHSSYVYFVDYSPDGRWLASACPFAPETFVWDLAAQRRSAAIEQSALGLGFTDDGQLMVTDELHDPVTGEPLGTKADPASWRRRRPDSVWSPDRARIAELKVGDRASPKIPLTVKDTAGNTVLEVPGPVAAADFDPATELLAIGGPAGRLEIWSLRTKTLLHDLSLHEGPHQEGPVHCVAFHPGGARLASAGHDGSIQLWDTNAWEFVHELRGHGSYVKSIAFSPDGTQLASGSGDFTVRIWDTIRVEERARSARDRAPRVQDALRHLQPR